MRLQVQRRLRWAPVAAHRGQKLRQQRLRHRRRLRVAPRVGPSRRCVDDPALRLAAAPGLGAVSRDPGQRVTPRDERAVDRRPTAAPGAEQRGGEGHHERPTAVRSDSPGRRGERGGGGRDEVEDGAGEAGHQHSGVPGRHPAAAVALRGGAQRCPPLAGRTSGRTGHQGAWLDAPPRGDGQPPSARLGCGAGRQVAAERRHGGGADPALLGGRPRREGVPLQQPGALGGHVAQAAFSPLLDLSGWAWAPLRALHRLAPGGGVARHAGVPQLRQQRVQDRAGLWGEILGTVLELHPAPAHVRVPGAAAPAEASALLHKQDINPSLDKSR